MTQHKHFDLDTLTELNNRPRQLDRTGWSDQANKYFYCACYCRTALLSNMNQLELEQENRLRKLDDETLIESSKSHFRSWKKFHAQLELELDKMKKSGLI